MHQVDDAIERMECALTITQFCMIENISKATYYKIRRAGLGPVETCAPLPGMILVRISPEARRAWHAKLQADHSRKTVELGVRASARNRSSSASAAPSHRCTKPTVAQHGGANANDQR